MGVPPTLAMRLQFCGPYVCSNGSKEAQVGHANRLLSQSSGPRQASACVLRAPSRNRNAASQAVGPPAQAGPA